MPATVPIASYAGPGAFSALTAQAGGGGQASKPVLVLAQSYANAPTLDTSEDILYTYNLPANTFNSNGSIIRITATWSTAANGNNKVPRIRFGGSQVAGTTTSSNNGQVIQTALITRTGPNAQYLNTLSLDSTISNTGTGTMAITDTAPIAITVTGQTPSGAGDITLRTVLIEFMGA